MYRVLAPAAGLLAMLVAVSGLGATAADATTHGQTITITVPDLQVLAISYATHGESFAKVVRSYMCASPPEPLLKEVATKPGAAIFKVKLSSDQVATIKDAMRSLNCTGTIRGDYVKSIRWWEKFSQHT